MNDYDVYVSLSAWDFFIAKPGVFATDVVIARNGEEHAYRRLDPAFLGYICSRIELAFERNLPNEAIDRAINLFYAVRDASGIQPGECPGNYRKPTVPKAAVATVFEREHPDLHWIGAVPGFNLKPWSDEFGTAQTHEHFAEFYKSGRVRDASRSR